ncbi:MAG: hypothetical protein AAGA68_21855 [Pseudomonadota bacterium]
MQDPKSRVANHSADRRRQRTGFEFEILTRLPNLYAATLVIPLVFALTARIMPGGGAVEEITRQTAMADIIAVAGWLTCWSLLFALTIGCFTVYVMKGPARVADSYPIPSREDDPPTEGGGP